MSMCADPDGRGIIAGTSDGALLTLDESGTRMVVSGLPCITTVHTGA
jgi:hypothetical protein